MLVVKTRPYNDEVLFRHTLINLCDDTHYTFSAYFLNLSRNGGGIAPDLFLKVETPAGVLIENRGIGTIDYEPGGPKWILHSIDDFTLPAGVTSIVVSIISKTEGGPLLNDLAIDDVAVKAVGQYKEANFDDDASSAHRDVCISDTRTFTATVTAPEGTNVLQWQHKLDDGKWEPIEGEKSINITIPPPGVAGMHRYRAASAPLGNIMKFECSVLSNELTIKVNPLVTVSAGPQKFYLRGGTPVVLEGNSNTTDLTWTVESGADISSLSNASIARPLATPNENTTYRLTAKPDVNTCGDEQFSTVMVIVADKVDVANIFTPNGDGINDNWIIGGIASYEKPSVQVYNRYGQLMFRSAGGNASPWDGTYNGKYVSAGSYYYIIDLGINGLKLSGSVTVLR
jgi:gliding motility-associated-like protein